MPVPSAISDLSQTAGSNSPTGGESPTTADDYFRAFASFIALLRDGKGLSVEVDLASAATCDIGGQNSPFVRITGTTTITSFSTNYNGPRFVRFGGALTLTHNATTLILPGAANITTAAGDTCIATPISGGWVVSQYQRASSPGELVSGTLQATTSGTAIDFTGIPAWVKRVTIQLVGVSTNGASNLLLQIGDSGGVETSGYLGAVAQITNAAATVSVTFTTGFGVTGAFTATSVIHGSITLTLQNASTNTWVSAGSVGFSDAASSAVSGCSKSLSATLDRVRLTTVSGDTFDAGSINLLYE